MHPYAVAKIVASLAFLHGRRIYLNMVAGGFKSDLEALDDRTPHDERYTRLAEYTTVIMNLLRGGPVTVDGRYYRITNVKMTPALPPALLPGVFVSGSSDAGLAAARQLGALAVSYPKPVAEYEASGTAPDAAALGIRIGIIAREDADDAWTVARKRFPEDRTGQLTHQLAMKVSDSEWHTQLSRLGETPASSEQPYWMVPFENYKTFCPYLVGSYDRVADEVARYVGVGYRTIILDVPAGPEELDHIGIVCERAAARVAP
jgi:alkanesulfonate monooxygenase